jgi:hypothetical protein
MASLVLCFVFEDVCIALLLAKEYRITLGRGVFGVQEFETLGVVLITHQSEFFDIEMARLIRIVKVKNVSHANLWAQIDRITLRSLFISIKELQAFFPIGLACFFH